MLIGEVYGKTGTRSFHFRTYKEVRRLDFVSVKSVEEGEKDSWVLCQVDSIESHPDGKDIALANVIGNRIDGALHTPKIPVRPSALVYTADDALIRDTLALSSDGLYLGILDANKTTKVFLDPKKLISRHLAVLASTGAGKSYAVAVILEELLEKKIPVVVIDPHGEYVSLSIRNDSKEELQLMKKYDVSPKSYDVVEYSPDPRVNPGAKQLSFSDMNLAPMDIAQLFPTRPTTSQLGVLYAAVRQIRDRGDYSLADLMNAVAGLDNPAKWNVMNLLESVRDMGLFRAEHTGLSDLVSAGRATVINLRGVAPEVQSLVAYKVVKDLFELRKVGRVPPMLLVVEEAHNFCPEREVVSSSRVMKAVASEGRKFGMGLAVISQRPARVDKSVLSQCNTQIILHMTNPNDLKAVSYAEGLTEGIEKEIKNLNVGTALILGLEFPIFVGIRTRRTKHGGVTVNVTEQPERTGEIPVFRSVSRDALAGRLGSVKTVYYPCFRISGDRNYVFDAVKGSLLYQDDGKTKEMAFDFSQEELKVLSLLSGIPAGEAAEKNALAESSGLSFSDFVSAFDLLLKNGFVSEERRANGAACALASFRMAELNLPVDQVRIDGEVLKARLSAPEIRERAKGFTKIRKIELVYYPYFIGKDFMIDGVTGVRKEFKE